MFNCASCDSRHTEGTVCSVCKKRYDFPCSGITEAGYRKLGERKSTWRCPKCKASSSQSPAASSPNPANQLDNIQEQLNRIAFQLTPIASLVEDVRIIKNEVSDLKQSLEMAHEYINRYTDKVNSLEARLQETEKTMEEIPFLRTEVARLNQELQDRDQRARANNVEIRGIPQKKNENLYEITHKIGDLCDFPYRKEDINYVARIPTRITSADKPIVVSFNSRYIKEEFVALARKSKQLTLVNLGFSASTNFYVNDHLTPYNKGLLSKARALSKEKNFQYIWVKHCKIMARKSDTSPIFIIRCEKDLLKIM